MSTTLACRQAKVTSASTLRLTHTGTPAQIVEKIERQREILGCDIDVLAIMKYGGMTDAEAAASMRLFARDVMPALRATATGRISTAPASPPAI